ncbi:MAG TPA: hypothetical protein VG099_03195, partial [Gemmataceae bacterium]|nr:hypothetical protein [Gemmataceae bacterium]
MSQTSKWKVNPTTLGPAAKLCSWPSTDARPRIQLPVLVLDRQPGDAPPEKPKINEAGYLAQTDQAVRKLAAQELEEYTAFYARARRARADLQEHERTIRRAEISKEDALAKLGGEALPTALGQINAARAAAEQKVTAIRAGLPDIEKRLAELKSALESRARQAINSVPAPCGSRTEAEILTEWINRPETQAFLNELLLQRPVANQGLHEQLRA